MILSELYEFFLDIPDGVGGVDTYEVRPVNDSITWEWSLHDDLANYERILTTDLIFSDSPNGAINDFTIIYIEEQNRNRCKKFVLRIIRVSCLGDRPAEYFRALFTLANCTFDVERCQVTVDLDAVTPYDCVLDVWEEDFNVQRSGLFIEVEGTGDLFIQPPNQAVGVDLVTLFHESTSPNVGLQGTVLEDQIIQFYQDNAGPYPGANFRVLTCVFDFQFNTSNPPGPGNWILTVEWVTSANNPPPPLVFSEHLPPVVSTPGQNFTWDWGNQIGLAVDGLQNGHTLKSMLLFQFNEMTDHSDCNELLRSDFFGINPDGSAPLGNPYYQFALDNLHNLAYFPAHDIAKTDETEASFRIEYSFKEVIDDLIVLFNLKFFKNVQAGDEWRLEHVTYGMSEQSYRLNLTEPEFLKFTSGRWQYSYDRVRIPKSEVWTFVEERRPGTDVSLAVQDFESADIQYDSACYEKNARDVTFRTQIFFTDFSLPINNEAFIGSKTYLLVALNVDNSISEDLGFNSGFSWLNAILGMPYLHDNLWKIRRPINQGTMNGEFTVFEFSQLIRSQVPITIPMCCEDFVQWQPFDLTKTQLGWGEIDTATYEEPVNRMTLNLKHD